MLLHLSIENYAIAEQIDIDFQAGMTTLTGETGAGKSILLGALALVLGERADGAAIHPGARQAEIHALFDLQHIPEARRWLEHRDLADGDGSECLLRRVVRSDGRSRGYVNGRPSTLQDLRELGRLLVDIHGQHSQQSLLQRDHQARLLDAVAGAEEPVRHCARLAREYRQLTERIEALQQDQGELEAREQLLRYQVEELDALQPSAEELALLESEQRQLASGEALLQAGQRALGLCKQGEINALSILHQAQRSLAELAELPEPLSEALTLLESAHIQVEEAAGSLRHFVDDFELNPARLHEVEQRLSALYELARKHRVQPEELPALHARLRAELSGLEQGDHSLAELENRRSRLAADWRRHADRLSQLRHQAAATLRREVEQQLQALAMEGSRFVPTLTPREEALPHPGGLERVEFLLSTTPGGPLLPLGRVASGGELSRISLAIQVVTARASATPTLIFDEVDVGIGGATAEVVGHLLQELGLHSQVLCVTHQPQVASQAHHHLQVEKCTDGGGARTRLTPLTAAGRVEELARMLGGIDITSRTRAHAAEMLHRSH